MGGLMLDNKMDNAIKNAVQNALHEAFGDDAAQIAQTVNELAERQGGRNIAENYQLLGKRALIVAGVTIVGIQAVVWVGRTVIARRAEAKRVERIVRRVLEEEHAKQAAEAVDAARAEEMAAAGQA